ncbi:MAG: 50S ribosomal protein L17 [Dysgonamonadaceae bacterium]|jgi:large subunit ribosomal protein L17|nr:50S ribosomal protein L17 [Dysgonamonadaceae bacterium]
MRHNNKNNHLGRKTAHRGAMLSNMAISLIMHKRIFTTVPKAKELRKFVEPIITKSKDDTTHSRRLVFSALQNKQAVTELFQTVSQKVGDRPGGYTRILKTGYRLGDNAAMCFIELVDFNENMLKEAGSKKAKTRRSRRKGAGESADVAEASPKAEKTPKAKAEKVEEAKVEESMVEAPQEQAVEDVKVEETSQQEDKEIAEEASSEDGEQ